MKYLQNSDKLPRIVEIIKTNLPDEMYLDFVKDGYLNLNKNFTQWLLVDEPTNGENLWNWHKYRLHMELLESYHKEISQLNKPTILSVDAELFPHYCLEHYLGTLLNLIVTDQSINEYNDKNLKQYEKHKALSSVYKHDNCGCQSCADWCYEKDSEKNQQMYWILHKQWDNNTTVLDNIERLVIKLCKPTITHCDDCICDLCRAPEPIYEMKIDNCLILSDLKHVVEDMNTIEELKVDPNNHISMEGIAYDPLKIKLENTTLFIEIFYLLC
jgi:hypothetical protein